MFRARFFVAPAAATFLGLTVLMPALAQGPGLTRLSDPVTGGVSGASTWPVVSPNGQYVAFNSDAENLHEDDSNGVGDVFVYNRDTGSLVLASVGTNGVQGDSSSYVGGVSSDGEVVFSSYASNLVGGDDNGAADVFVRDVPAGTTERIGDAIEDMWGYSGNVAPTISANGNRVAYLSWVPGAEPFSGGFQLHLYNRQFDNVSILLGQTEGLDYPVISADGDTVAFESSEALTTADDDSLKDVYLHNVNTGNEILASVDDQTGWIAGLPQITHDGQHVAFQWLHCPPVPAGWTCEPDDWDTLLFDRTAGSTTAVAVSSSEVRGNELSLPTGISANGRYVSFWSNASNLVSGDTNGLPDVFVRDRADGGDTTRVSVSASGDQGDESSTWSAIGPSGGFIAFESWASTMVSGDTNGTGDIFMRNL